MNRQQEVYEQINVGVKNPSAIAKAIGCSTELVGAALNALVKRKAINRTGHGTYECIEYPKDRRGRKAKGAM